MNYLEEFEEWEGKPIPQSSVPDGVKWHQLLRYSDEYDVAIETGTGGGATTAVLAGTYGEVWSIELSNVQYEKAKRNLANFKNVTLLHGSSTKYLSDVVESVGGPAVYYLDGHYNGYGLEGHETTPIARELESIAECDYPNVVVIDDARLFAGEEWHEEGYPSFALIQLLVSTFQWPSKVFRERDAFVIEPLEK